MGLNQAQATGILARDERNAQEIGTTAKPMAGGSGRETMRISKEAYFNAIDVNGGVAADGSNIWHDDGFARDMQRRHPHTRVTSDRISICTMESTGCGGRPANRFGRIKERTVYGEAGKRTIQF